MSAFILVLMGLVIAGIAFAAGHLFGEDSERERQKRREEEAKATAWTKTYREKRDAR